MQTSDGHLLGGRLRYRQPVDGYRTGIEPILLAAAIPAEPGQRVLEAGTGAGAGLICLAARVPIEGTGLELDPAMAALARHNVAANRLDRLTVVQGDLRLFDGTGFDHVFANPPWHDPASTASPFAARRLAKQASPTTLSDWTRALLHAARPTGTLTLALPAARAEAARMLLAAAGRLVDTLLLLPRPDRPAKLAILQAGGAAAGEIRTLVLHADAGGYTAAVEAVLRHGHALPGADRPGT